MNRVAGKWILITGATSGIGKASAKIFAECRSNLILTGRRDDRLSDISEELQDQYNIEVQTFCFDIRNSEACKNCVDSLKYPVDVLLNNAGLASGKGTINNADFEDWEKMIDTNIKGLLYMTRYISEKMRKRNAGHIINVGSIAGYESYPGGSVYCATKHAVKAITESSKMDLLGTNIRVSSVSPGLVETEFSKVRFHGDENKASEVYKNMKPLSDMDIAEIILFMANRPPHVNILDTIVFPTAQSSATRVARNS